MDAVLTPLISPSHPVWGSDQMRAAVDADLPGTVVRIVRLAAGLSQQELGERCGYSGSTISRIENGNPPLDQVTVRRKLCRVLSIPPAYLGISEPPGRHTPRRSLPASAGADTLDPETSEGDGGVRRRTFIGQTAAAGLVAAMPGDAGSQSLLFHRAHTGRAPDTAQLARSLNSARAAYAHSRYTQLGAALPDLLADLRTGYETAGTDSSRQRAGELLTYGYVLASRLSVKRGDDAIGWVLADRALHTARHIDSATAEAAAAHTVAIAMRRSGHQHDAIDVLNTTAQALGDRDEPMSPTLIAAYGSLLCTAAYSSAQTGASAAAIGFLTEAAEAARRVDGTAHGTIGPFSTDTVGIYAIGVHTALGDTATALRHATPAPSSRACYLPGNATAGSASTPPAPGTSTDALTKPPKPCCPLNASHPRKSTAGPCANSSAPCSTPPHRRPPGYGTWQPASTSAASFDHHHIDDLSGSSPSNTTIPGSVRSTSAGATAGRAPQARTRLPDHGHHVEAADRIRAARHAFEHCALPAGRGRDRAAAAPAATPARCATTWRPRICCR